MTKRLKRPRDAVQLAKLIGDIATGQVAEPSARELKALTETSRRGGLKGGKARAKKLTPEQRSAIAREAARVRWKKTR